MNRPLHCQQAVHGKKRMHPAVVRPDEIYNRLANARTLPILFDIFGHKETQPPGSFRRFAPLCLFGSLTIVNTAARFAQNFISPPVFCSPGRPAGKDKPFAATPKTANISKQFFKTARRIIYPSKKLQLLHYTQSLLFFNLIAKTIRFITLCTVAGYGDCSMRANRNAKKRPATEAAGLFRLPKLKTCSQL